MTSRFLRTLTAASLGGALLLGCPGDEAPPTGLRAGVGAAGSEAVAKALAKARASVDPPPPPSLDKLCALQFGRTDYEQAKKLFGKPADESMDKSSAGLSYRYQTKTKDGMMVAVALLLKFSWSDGEPGAGTIIFGIGGSPEDLLSGYLLSEASITGMPYPSCWPHEEP